MQRLGAGQGPLQIFNVVTSPGGIPYAMSEGWNKEEEESVKAYNWRLESYIVWLSQDW